MTNSEARNLLAWVDDKMQALPEHRTPVAHGKAELLDELRSILAQNPASLPASIDASPETATDTPSTLNGPYAANLGDGANGQLSEAIQRVEAVVAKGPDGSIQGYYVPADEWRSIRAELRSIVREHTERAWDEGRESIALDMAKPMGDDGMRPATPNPYRAARQEQNR